MSNKRFFYIVGAACIAAVAAVGITVSNNIKSDAGEKQYEMELKTQPKTTEIDIKPAAVPKSDVPKETDTSAQANSTEVKRKTAKQISEEKEKNIKFIMPTEGVVTTKFSSDALVYSPTFDDWRTHTGIDIDAEPDTQVKAVLDGTVEKVYLDEMMGNTIEINHGGGLLTRYSNLSTTELVKEGAQVKQGDIISGIGNTAAAEKMQNPHLHFEVIYEGAQTDPLEKLKSEIIMP